MHGKSFLYALRLLILQFLQIEWRIKQILSNTFLYLCALLLILYLSIDYPNHQVFMAFFWVSELFIILHLTQKSAEQSRKTTDAFFYFLVSPEIYMGAKIAFNVILSIIFSAVNSFFFFVLFQHITLPIGWFLLTLLGGIVGLSTLFSFISALSQNTESPNSLSVLSMPLLFPLLMLCLQISAMLIQNSLHSIYFPLSALYLLDILMIGLSLILYSSLWRL